MRSMRFKSGGRNRDSLANNLPGRNSGAMQLAVGFEDQLNGFFEILARLVECFALRIRTRQLLNVPHVAAAFGLGKLFVNCRKRELHMQILAEGATPLPSPSSLPRSAAGRCQTNFRPRRSQRSRRSALRYPYSLR